MQAGRTFMSLALSLVAAGAATAVALAAQAPQEPVLQPDVARVAAGGTLVLHGHGFPAGAHLVLRAGERGGATRRIGSADTGRRGTFVARIAINRRVGRGHYVAVVCQQHCRVKASTSFRVVRR